MDAKSTTASGSTSRKMRRIFPVLLTLCLAAYAVMLAFKIGAYAGDSDSSGYMNNARLLSEGRVSVAQRRLPVEAAGNVAPFTFVPLGFRPVKDGAMVPTYPTGLPLILAAISTVTNWSAGPFLAIGIQSWLGVVLVYVLGRRFGLERGWALLGAAMLGLGPLYLFLSFQVLSDMPSMVWTTAAILLAWDSRSNPGFLRPLGTGAVFAMAVLVRPSNFLAVVPLALVLGFDWRRWFAFGLGGLPGAVFLAVYNNAAYGSVFASGYQGIPNLISVAAVAPTLLHYVRWLPVLMTPVAILGFGLPWLSKPDARAKSLLIAWIIVFCGFYACYYFTRETWWYLRFVLPAFPPMIIASLLVTQALVRRLRSRVVGMIAATAITCLVLAWSGWWAHRLYVFDTGVGISVYPQAAGWARENLPKDAVIVAMQTSGSLFFYTDFTFVRWDVLQPGSTALVNKSLAAQNRPLYAILFPFEEDALKARIPGNWRKVGAVRHVSIWRRDSTAAPESQLPVPQS